MVFGVAAHHGYIIHPPSPRSSGNSPVRCPVSPRGSLAEQAGALPSREALAHVTSVLVLCSLATEESTMLKASTLVAQAG